MGVDSNTNLNDYQSLSEKTRVIFLSAPPINEAQIRESLRWVCVINADTVLCMYTWFLFSSSILFQFLNDYTSCETTIRILGDLGRTNESCGIYSEACLELCKEVGVKAVDLWTVLQQRDDWLDVCFT